MNTTRKASIQDLPQLAELFDQYRVFYHKESDVSGAESFLKERIESKDSEIFVAEDHGNVVGFV
jgi:N-acetylglutamate synthase-like GNAT family acetyltransferase